MSAGWIGASKENTIKIVFFDTESTDLKAMMGRILCASFVPLEGEPYTFRFDKKPWRGKNKIDDSRLCVAIRDELEKYNLIVGWNSKLHDIPLLNARLSKAGERPYHCQNFHLDAMWYAGGSSQKIGSRKLDNVSKFYGLDDQKTEISWDEWQLAGTGDPEAMDTVIHHCEQDVKVTRGTYWKLLPFVANLHR